MKSPASQHGLHKTYYSSILRKLKKLFSIIGMPVHPSIMIINAAIKRVEEYKYLGTAIDLGTVSETFRTRNSGVFV